MSGDRYVAYVRVSTDRQGASGLGLEAQLTAIRTRLGGGDCLIQPPYVEIESGRMRDRPVLAEALARCRLLRATLVVAKIDRLARDAAFVAKITESGVPVLFGDLPEAQGAVGAFMLGMMAQVAQLEAGLISERTKAALAARRARGLPLGTPGNLKADAAAHGRALGRAAASGKAAARVADLAPVVRQLQADGYRSLTQLAAALNARRIPTARGGDWSAVQVSRVLARLGPGAAT